MRCRYKMPNRRLCRGHAHRGGYCWVHWDHMPENTSPFFELLEQRMMDEYFTHLSKLPPIFGIGAN